MVLYRWSDSLPPPALTSLLQFTTPGQFYSFLHLRTLTPSLRTNSNHPHHDHPPPPPPPALIWFLLLDSKTGEPYKKSSVSSIECYLVTVPVIDQFWKFVHRKNSPILPGIAPSQLLIYKNKASFDKRNNAKDEGKEEPLDPTESINGLGSKEDMLVVVVPPPFWLEFRATQKAVLRGEGANWKCGIWWWWQG